MTTATSRQPADDVRTRTRGRSIRLPSIFLGIGLGGFFDGIVLHQILQWHHMLTSTRDYPATTVAGLESSRAKRSRNHQGRRSQPGEGSPAARLMQSSTSTHP